MQKKFSIGLDIGHSQVKARASLYPCMTSTPTATVQFPTAVVPTIHLSNEQTRRRAEHDTVRIGDRQYFVGETALRQSRLAHFTGLHGGWIMTEQHDALVVAAWQRAIVSLGASPADIQLVVGLPAKLYAAQKAALKERLTTLIESRLFAGQQLRVLVQSQAEAPLQWLSIREDGSLHPEYQLDHQSWAVVEVGHFTSDFSLSEHGNVVEYAVHSCAGVRQVYEAVAKALDARGIPSTLELVDRAVRGRELVLWDQRHDLNELVEQAAAPFSEQVADEAERLFHDHAPTMNGLLVAGGGASLVFDRLKQRFRHAVMSDEPRMTVAEGYRRLGMYALSCRPL